MIIFAVVSMIYIIWLFSHLPESLRKDMIQKTLDEMEEEDKVIERTENEIESDFDFLSEEENEN